MILADKLIDLRKRSGWSQEELAERLGVSRQSISKWESAQSVPDMNRILALSDLFGVTTDYLLRDEIEPAETPVLPVAADEDGAIPARRVSLEEANAFLTERRLAAARVSLGVVLCILSPAALIFLAGGADYGTIPLSEGAASGIGLVVLLLMVAAAVALFITTSLRMNRFEYLEKEFLDTEYGVDGMARERWERCRPAHARLLTIGVVLCILAAIPLFAAIEADGPWQIAAVPTLLLLVAAGVFLIVRSAMMRAGFLMLLEEGDYTRENKLENSKNTSVRIIYWGCVLTAYLIWSFLSGRWDMTWILWAVSGILYGVLCAALRILRKQP